MVTENSSTIEKIIDNLINIHPLLSKNLNRTIRTKTNLNPGTLFVLGILNRYEMLSMSEIGTKLAMPKPHVTAQIDKLIEEEMVERLFDPNDRRIINIKLTEKGKKDFKQIKKKISAEMSDLIETLDEDKKLSLLEASGKVRSILSAIMMENSTK